ncbi:sodium/glutamate symporter [Thalassotalea eurytherma]|uniref:Sodium/glutamate symporter n=1 Tax=Thalassotalea eurytherma TaxID=1144278 RepID=A0ABQ6GYP2_9GAMM|nr:sodium/glutamate symporter [Thalassotalea eurytherma]GLX81071.1 sodium/glutamate symporter [Thalassotalea eurytherma]
MVLIDSFMTLTIAIIVFFIGSYITTKVQFLQRFNIPEPVTGGLLAASISFLLYFLWQIEINFTLDTRDTLLVYFFTCIGINARISDLYKGGKPLVILLVLTLSYIVIQDIIGVSSAKLLDLNPAMGVLTGSASLIGGHGTAIAWADEIEKLGVNSALEIGIASATLGLVVASLLGGPIAKYLIGKYKLESEQINEPVVGVSYEQQQVGRLSHLSFMSSILIIHICIIIGYIANLWLNELGIKLPLFVTSLIAGIILSNTIPVIFKKVNWPDHTKALAIISDLSLSLFLTMSLMSMQLWTIAGLAGPLLLILFFQTIGTVFYILWVVFPLMGRDYQASVLSAGFGGFALGATPTAIANMTAVTKTHGPAPMAFIILPLVAAFFVDITNSFVIKYILSLVQ